jgi:hypothetical protein
VPEDPFSAVTRVSSIARSCAATGVLRAAIALAISNIGVLNVEAFLIFMIFL